MKKATRHRSSLIGMARRNSTKIHEIVILPFEIVGSPLCVASDDGQKVYERIAKSLRDGQKVIVSFHNVTSLTCAFLNAAIGQLDGKFSVDQIRANLQVKDMVPEDLVLLQAGG